MDEEQYVVDQGNRIRTPDVEGKNQQNDGEDEQRSLPTFGLIARIVDGEESLNDSPDEKRSRRLARLPG